MIWKRDFESNWKFPKGNSYLTIVETRTSMFEAKSIKLNHERLRERNETTAKRVNKQMMEQVADKVRKLCLALKTQTTDFRHGNFSRAHFPSDAEMFTRRMSFKA